MQLARLPLAKSKKLPGIDTERAEVIVGGVAIYARLLTWAGAAELVTSDRGIRWGLAFERASLGEKRRRKTSQASTPISKTYVSASRLQRGPDCGNAPDVHRIEFVDRSLDLDVVVTGESRLLHLPPVADAILDELRRRADLRWRTAEVFDHECLGRRSQIAEHLTPRVGLTERVLEERRIDKIELIRDSRFRRRARKILTPRRRPGRVERAHPALDRRAIGIELLIELEHRLGGKRPGGIEDDTVGARPVHSGERLPLLPALIRRDCSIREHRNAALCAGQAAERSSSDGLVSQVIQF
jgi:hypothetical protein